jgi:hypothetical protein
MELRRESHAEAQQMDIDYGFVFVRAIKRPIAA